MPPSAVRLAVPLGMLLLGCRPGAGQAPPAVPPTPPGVEAIETPFGGPLGYPADAALTKANVNGLALVGTRLYASHGTTDSPVSNGILYFDTATGRWGRDADPDGRPLDTDQEGTSRVRVGPTGRLYLNSFDPRDRHRHVFMRRAVDGRWTLRPIGPEGHSYDVAEVLDGPDTVVVAHAGILSVGWPSVFMSEDDGRSWRTLGRVVGEEVPVDDALPTATFFTFNDRLYLGGLGRLRPEDRRPFLLRYVPKAQRAAPDSVFEVVAWRHEEVVPAPARANVLDEAAEIGAGPDRRLVWRGGCAVFSTPDLTAARTEPVAFPEGACARSMARVGDSLYVLTRPRPRSAETASRLFATADGRTWHERLRLDGLSLLSLAWAPALGRPTGEGHFYFGAYGVPPAPALYRVAYPLARPSAPR